MTYELHAELQNLARCPGGCKQLFEPDFAGDAEILARKAFSAPAAFLKNCRRLDTLPAAVLSLVALLVCGAYSVTAALGSAAGSRLAAHETARNFEGKRARIERAYGDAERALAIVAPARTRAEVEPLIAAKLVQARIKDGCAAVWLANSAQRAVCIEIEGLKEEAARADERERLSVDMARARADLDELPVGKVANADAVALQGYLAAIGLQADLGQLNRILVLLAVLVIELGGGLALAVGTGLASGAVTVDGRALETVTAAARVAISLGNAVAVSRDGQPEPSTSPTQAPMALGPSAGQRLVKRTSERDAVRDRVLTTVMTSGGRLVASERALAEMVRATRGTTRNAVQELVAAGRLARVGSVLVAA